MINKIFLSEMKLKKKIINDNKNFSEAEKNNYFINKNQKLTNHCHFDYKETIKKVTKKTAMKIIKKTNQKNIK